jgi:hypothetical protein
MSLTEKIIENVNVFPESKQRQILNFVEYLRAKTENDEWADFSLSTAMKGMEDEKASYSIDDLKEIAR